MHGQQRGMAFRTNAENCPKCRVSLQGPPIPDASRHMFGATHYSRKIGIYDATADRTSHWQCPDCGHEWERR